MRSDPEGFQRIPHSKFTGEVSRKTVLFLPVRTVLNPKLSLSWQIDYCFFLKQTTPIIFNAVIWLRIIIHHPPSSVSAFTKNSATILFSTAHNTFLSYFLYSATSHSATTSYTCTEPVLFDALAVDTYDVWCRMWVKGAVYLSGKSFDILTKVLRT